MNLSVFLEILPNEIWEKIAEYVFSKKEATRFYLNNRNKGNDDLINTVSKLDLIKQYHKNSKTIYIETIESIKNAKSLQRKEGCGFVNINDIVTISPPRTNVLHLTGTDGKKHIINLKEIIRVTLHSLNSKILFRLENTILDDSSIVKIFHDILKQYYIEDLFRSYPIEIVSPRLKGDNLHIWNYITKMAKPVYYLINIRKPLKIPIRKVIDIAFIRNKERKDFYYEVYYSRGQSQVCRSKSTEYMRSMIEDGSFDLGNVIRIEFRAFDSISKFIRKIYIGKEKVVNVLRDLHSVYQRKFLVKEYEMKIDEDNIIYHKMTKIYKDTDFISDSKGY